MSDLPTLPPIDAPPAAIVQAIGLCAQYAVAAREALEAAGEWTAADAVLWAQVQARMQDVCRLVGALP